MIEARSRKHCSHNRILLSLLLVLLYPSLLFAEDIPLIKKGGVYEVPVEVNGAITLNFILDTGASEVNIPADVALTLYRAGTIRESDFLPGQTYRLADGSLLKSSRFLLQSLKIGKNRIANVPASIGNTASPLLLGQSFLERLGAWGVDSQKQVLTIGTKVEKEASTAKQAYTQSDKSLSIPKSVELEEFFIKDDKLSYAGYDIERDFNQREKRSFATIKKDGKILAYFDKGCCWKDSTRIGLLSLLGNELKQLIIEQYSGGASCCYSYKIYQLLPQLRLIFDDQTYKTGYYPLEIEGEEKLILIRMIRPLTDFCNACTLVTIAVFSYDSNLGRYVLSNKNFANYILQRQHSQRSKNKLDENEKREILSAFLDYVYAGREAEAWKLYNSKYTDTDKEELRQNILREFQSDTIHYAIYNR